MESRPRDAVEQRAAAVVNSDVALGDAVDGEWGKQRGESETNRADAQRDRVEHGSAVGALRRWRLDVGDGVLGFFASGATS